MRMPRALVVVLAAALAVAACSGGDSPTESGSAPVISQLQVHGAQRVAGGGGVVSLSFSYVDPDRDVDRLVFRGGDGATATNPLRDVGTVAGTAHLQQAVDLPASGEEVSFAIHVVDRDGHPSNQLAGAFSAP